MIHDIDPQHLRRKFNADELGIETTKDIHPLTGIIGQARAVSALRVGLGMQQAGFHIYVAGPSGIGKMTTVQAFLQEMAQKKATPSDWCYVNNFIDPYQPRVCELPVGWGHQLQQDMKTAIERIRHEIPRAFDSEAYSAKRDEIVKALQTQREVIFERLNDQAVRGGFTLQSTPTGLAIIPTLSGRPLSDAEFQALPTSARDEMRTRRESLQGEMKEDFKQLRNLERAAQEQIQSLDQQVTLYIVGELMEDLLTKYSDYTNVTDYLKTAQNDILENIDLFRSGPPAPSSPGEGLAALTPWTRDLPFRRYQVNVLVDNSKTQGAPVIVVTNPTFNNLFGRVEKETQYGTLYTDFTMLKAGALHYANGGYIVIRAEDLLREYPSWDSIKRALRSREIHIEELSEHLGYLTTKGLQPEPIKLDTQVVLIGTAGIYYSLHNLDTEFPELFKIKADFDSEMPCTDASVKDFLSFVCTFCEREKLNHLDKFAAAALLEYALRLTDDQEKISTHFGTLANVIRESHYWATQADALVITAEHIRQALENKVYRSSLIQDRYQELTMRGEILIDTVGECIGQVNGLSVLSLGDYDFGRPTRITATVEPGHSGIIDIERQVALGGPIHSKGILILNGYLGQKYATDRPLALAASLVFEQSYSGIEGDSASSAELYALLSALSRLPIKQCIAVTGSVNQFGFVQAIGGINEKIEGFYDLCKARGLTGKQGVIMPHSNLIHLMLRDDVVDAVRSGQFHVWAVSTIDEGIEILTGVSAGSRSESGRFTEGSVNNRVDGRLRDLSEPK